MSLFNDERYTWRETYFVLFDPARRPRLEDIRRELRIHSAKVNILESKLEPDGTLVSLTLASYDDHAALEISYREGNDVRTETALLAETLEKGCTNKERDRLREAAQYCAKFEILHFEQTAGTAAFKIVKMPVLKFDSWQQNTKTGKAGGLFPNGRQSDRLTHGRKSGKTRFHFDPDSYENCANDGAGAELDRETDESTEFERIDPNTLVLVLEILCRLSRGIAIDPASGIVI
jgi:hypothetical protein